VPLPSDHIDILKLPRSDSSANLPTLHYTSPQMMMRRRGFEISGKLWWTRISSMPSHLHIFHFVQETSEVESV